MNTDDTDEQQFVPRARLRFDDLLADAILTSEAPIPASSLSTTAPPTHQLAFHHAGPRRRRAPAALCAVGDRLVSGHQDARARLRSVCAPAFCSRSIPPVEWLAEQVVCAGAGAACVRRGAGAPLRVVVRRAARTGAAHPSSTARGRAGPCAASTATSPTAAQRSTGDLIFTGAGEGALLCRDRRGNQPRSRMLWRLRVSAQVPCAMHNQTP